MEERLTLSWRGEQYVVVRQDERDATPEPGPVWQVMRGGAPLTSFPAQHRERFSDIREKVLEWLEANESRPEADVGRH
jgi:hypothetical protein